MTPAIVAAWLVHLYTASGFVLAFLATVAVIEGDFRSAFLYLWLQVAVDATDGWLARRAKVAERLPGFSGKTLDELVDFLTYVFVPALAEKVAKLRSMRIQGLVTPQEYKENLQKLTAP